MTTIAVIGLGSIGIRHARNLAAAGLEVRGYDPDASRRAMLGEIGGKAFETAEQALSGASAAVVASPTARHVADMRLVLDAGCHVLIEKPIASQLDGVGALIDGARRKGLVVFPGLNLRLHPAIQEARALVSDGAIGRTLWARLMMSSYLPGWRPHQDYRTGYVADPASGGIVLDVIHEIDLAHHLMGSLSLMQASATRTGALDATFADVVDIVLRRKDGAQASIHLDYVTRPRRRRTEIAGEKGLIEIDLDARRLTQWDVDGGCVVDTQFAGTYADDYVTETTLFLDCIAGRAKPPCSGEEALEVLNMAIEIRDAAERIPA